MPSDSSVRLYWEGRTNNPGLETHHTQYATIARVYPAPIAEVDALCYEANQRIAAAPTNRILWGDNLPAMQYLLDVGFGNRFDLIYIDPPYLSNQNYPSRVEIGEKFSTQTVSRQVFRDAGHQQLEEFLADLFPRLQIMKTLLNDNGSLFVHLDWHASHYVKILLDEVFSPDRLVNEIVWCYGGGSGTKRHFHRKHDIILWYAKGSQYIFNPQYRPYSSGTLQRGLTRVKGDRYQLHAGGALMQDWWTDINKILSPTARENLKFPTQKPMALLHRIIAAASNPGSLVGDFYAGSGTVARVCEDMSRDWIVCDNSQVAVQTALRRLIREKSRSFSLESDMLPDDLNDRLLLHSPVINELNKGEYLLHIGIDDYHIRCSMLSEGNKPLPFVTSIDFWEVDLDYDGQLFHSDLQMLRNGQRYDGSLPLHITVRLEKSSNSRVIAVRVHDILGETSLAVMPMDERADPKGITRRE